MSLSFNPFTKKLDIVGAGASDHAALSHLAFADSGHTGFIGGGPLTSTRVPFANVSGLLADDGNLTFASNILSVGTGSQRSQMGLTYIASSQFLGANTTSMIIANQVSATVANIGITGGANVASFLTLKATSANGVGSEYVQVLTGNNGSLVSAKFSATGATLIGGNTVSSVLNLQATSANGIGSEYVRVKAGNNGGTTVSEFSSGGITDYTTHIISKNDSSGPWSDSNHLILSNTTGTASHIDFKFGGTHKASIGASSIGDMYLKVSNGKAFAFESSYSTYAQIGATGFYTSESGIFSKKVWVGASSSNFPSTLAVTGSLGLYPKYYTTNTVLDNTAAIILADAANAYACLGTPTYACSSHSNETACNSNDYHGGCSWVNVGSCSVYNSDYSGCVAAPGCSWEYVACSTIGDESTCNATSPCSWVPPAFTGCTGNIDTYCNQWNSYTISDCQTNSGTLCTMDNDYGTCYPVAGCSQWDGDETTCGAFTSYGCTQNYSSAYCGGGSYETGNCLGYEGYCTGTASCTNIDGEGNCGAESGCTYTAGMTLTLPPNNESGIDITNQRTYWIKNIGTTGTVNIVPNTSQTVEKTTSISLATGEAAMLTLGKRYANCDVFTDESSCSSHGCTWYEETSSCSGSYLLENNWYRMGAN